MSQTQNSLKKITDEVIVEGKSFENSKLSADDLVSVNEEQIKAKIGELMDTLMDPNSGNKVPDVDINVQKKPAFLRRRNNRL